MNEHSGKLYEKGNSHNGLEYENLLNTLPPILYDITHKSRKQDYL